MVLQKLFNLVLNGSKITNEGMDSVFVEEQTRRKPDVSVFQRLHKIHGYHAYCQYDMAFAEISSEEEESSSESKESSSESEESSS